MPADSSKLRQLLISCGACMHRRVSRLRGVLRGDLEHLAPEEKRFLTRSLVLCFLIPVGLAFVFVYLNMLVWSVVILLLWIGLPSYVLVRSIFHWSQSDDSLVRSLGRDLRVCFPGAPITGTAARAKGVPLATVGLILACAAVYYANPEAQGMYALSANSLPEFLRTSLSSMFAHANPDHLWGNMYFLWVFGSALEGRLGRKRFFLYYVICGIAAGFCYVVAYKGIGFVTIVVRETALQVDGPGASGWLPPAIGASGAISGLLGLFAIRCYCSRVSLAVPIFGVLGAALPVVFRVEVSALLFLGLFFLFNLTGAHWGGGNIGYWAHVGGFGFGLALAYGTGLYREGVREELAAAMCRRTEDSCDGATEARDALLRLEPNHVDALLARARAESRYVPREGAAEDYERVVRLLLATERKRAAEVYAEYFRKFGRPLPAREQLLLAPVLAELGELDIAARSLERVRAESHLDPDDREKILLYEAKLLSDLALPDAAARVYEEFLRDYPSSARAFVAKERLTRLRSLHPA